VLCTVGNILETSKASPHCCDLSVHRGPLKVVPNEFNELQQ
jgi:hypothetical protein